MILYYAPGACSQAPHIILHETGASHSIRRVDLRAHKLDDGSDYRAINPKGSVPALALDDGELLTENAVVLQYIAEKSGNAELLPPAGDLRRYRVLEWLNFVATELHKGFSPLFNPATTEETRRTILDTIGKKLDYVAEKIGSGPYLLGERLTLPDAYLLVVLGWAEMQMGSLDRWPALARFRQHMAQRPSVRRALQHEGLLEPAAAD